MNTTLRVCLAMGGGVSLGSFSGSALTEALKLLLIYGKDEQGNPYKNVVVDGMSGASAGAIALTILLRCLVDYKSMLLKGMPVEDAEKGKAMEDLTSDREMLLEKELADIYFKGSLENFNKLGTTKTESLKALQLSQKIQEILWVDSVDAEQLYGSRIKKDYQHRLDDSFGLLERRHMEKLIAEYLLDGTPNIENLEVLDKDRVLFACSLTNILPMPINPNEDKLNDLRKNVLNSTGVFNHAEVRVIDYVFNETICENKPSDNRWLKFSAHPNQEDKRRTHFDVTKDEAWAIISASALACGAFPIAFPPVLLKRYQEEYDVGEQKTGAGKRLTDASIMRTSFKVKQGAEQLITEWPNAFLEVQRDIKDIEEERRNSFFNDSSGTRMDYKSFNFPYVDGGTFNNEPIKEAYRIASFQDYKRRDVETTERLVLFVDPIVRKEQFPNFNVSSFSPILGNGDPKESSEISKLSGAVGSLIGLLKDQGRIKEGDRIRDISENLALKEVLFQYLGENEDIMLSTEVCLKAFDKILSNLNENIISIGTRQPIEYFIEQLRTENGEKWEGKDLDQLEQEAESIAEDLFEATKSPTLDEIFTVFGIKGKRKSINIFAATVFKVMADVSLDTAGKNPKAINAAILPINEKKQIIHLPGTEIEAFAGFASKPSKKYAFEYGRFATLKALGEIDGFRDPGKGGAYLQNVPNGSVPLVDLNEYFKQSIRDSNFYSETNDYELNLIKDLFEPTLSRIKSLLPKALQKVWKVPGIFTIPLGGVLATIGGVFVGVGAIFKGKSLSIRSLLVGVASKSADSVNYISHAPITISLIGENFSKPFYRWHTKKRRIKVTVGFDKGDSEEITAIRSKDKNRIWFRLYLLKHTTKGEFHMTKQHQAVMPSGSKGDPIIRMVADYQTMLPNTKKPNMHLDPNLDFDAWAKALRNSFPKEVSWIKVEGLKRTIGLPSNKLNSKKRSLYHSLKNHNFHVNPMLEFDTRKPYDEWYFKENTQSFDDELLQNVQLGLYNK